MFIRSEHFDTYEDETVKLLIKSDGEITIGRPAGAGLGGGGFFQTNVVELQRIVHIVRMHLTCNSVDR